MFDKFIQKYIFTDYEYTTTLIVQYQQMKFIFVHKYY